MYVKIPLAESHKAGDMQDAIRSKMMKLNPVQPEELYQEWMDRGERPLSRWMPNKTHSPARGIGTTSALVTRHGQQVCGGMKPMEDMASSSPCTSSEPDHCTPSDPKMGAQGESAIRAWI